MNLLYLNCYLYLYNRDTSTVIVERLLYIILNKFTLMGLRQSEINNSNCWRQAINSKLN